MLLREQVLLLLAFTRAGFLFLALKLSFLLAQRLQHRFQIPLNPRGFLQHNARLLIDFLCGFRQFYLRHSTLAPPHSA